MPQAGSGDSGGARQVHPATASVTPQQKAVAGLVLAALLAVVAVLATRIVYLHTAYSLADHGHWIGSKAELARSVTGSRSFMLTRPALRGGHLDLSAWHGFQEVLYRQPLSPRSARFRFALDENAYLVFVFGRSADRFSGIRLSRNARHPSIAFEATVPGEFLRRTPLDVEPGPGWVDAIVRFDTDGVSLELGGEVVARVDMTAPPGRSLGFRGGLARVLVDDVVVEQRDGLPTVEDDFSGSDPKRLTRFATAFALLAAPAALALARVRSRRGLFVLIMLGLNAAALAAVAFAGEHYYVSGRYPDEVDTTRHAFRQNTARPKEERIAEYARTMAERRFRIMLIGGSQTWTAGAASLEQTIHGYLEKLLAERPGGGACIGVLNLGVSAWHSGIIVPAYIESFSTLDPDLVVLNASVNDHILAPEQRFEENVRELLAFNAARGIATVLMLEAFSEEDSEREPGIRAQHAILRRLAAETETPLIDMHEHLAGLEDTGFLWWDFVHLTSYGQDLLARRLMVGIESMVPSCP